MEQLVKEIEANNLKQDLGFLSEKQELLLNQNYQRDKIRQNYSF